MYAFQNKNVWLIPYRLGTTDCLIVLRATENPMLCQFLIGKIQHLARIKDWSKNDNVCQFLIGKVQQWDIRDTLIDKKSLCQFLTGKVQQ